MRWMRAAAQAMPKVAAPGMAWPCESAASVPATSASPAPTVVATGTAPLAFTDAGTLPPGLVIDTNTGAVTGTPTSAVSQSVTITANNGVMPSAAQTFTMAIAPAAAGVTAVPTLGEWGLLLMACLMGGAGWWQVRRRTTSGWPAP